jgi:hypothetical protein
MLMITPADLLGIDVLRKDGDCRDGSKIPAGAATTNGEELACNWAGDSCPSASDGSQGLPAATDRPAK